jgi:hypothetical protein
MAGLLRGVRKVPSIQPAATRYSRPNSVPQRSLGDSADKNQVLRYLRWVKGPGEVGDTTRRLRKRKICPVLGPISRSRGAKDVAGHQDRVEPVWRSMNLFLIRWLMRKHKHLAGHKTRAAEMLRRWRTVNRLPSYTDRWGLCRRPKDGSRMSREVQVRFCERLEVKFLWPTHPLWERCLTMASILEKPSKGIKSTNSKCPSAGAHSNTRSLLVRVWQCGHCRNDLR